MGIEAFFSSVARVAEPDFSFSSCSPDILLCDKLKGDAVDVGVVLADGADGLANIGIAAPKEGLGEIAGAEGGLARGKRAAFGVPANGATGGAAVKVAVPVLVEVAVAGTLDLALRFALAVVRLDVVVELDALAGVALPVAADEELEEAMIGSIA